MKITRAVRISIKARLEPGEKGLKRGSESARNSDFKKSNVNKTTIPILRDLFIPQRNFASPFI